MGPDKALKERKREESSRLSQKSGERAAVEEVLPLCVLEVHGLMRVHDGLWSHRFRGGEETGEVVSSEVERNCGSLGNEKIWMHGSEPGWCYHYRELFLDILCILLCQEPYCCPGMVAHFFFF